MEEYKETESVNGDSLNLTSDDESTANYHTQKATDQAVTQGMTQGVADKGVTQGVTDKDVTQGVTQGMMTQGVTDQGVTANVSKQSNDIKPVTVSSLIVVAMVIIFIWHRYNFL